MTVDAMRTYISETYNSDVIRGRHIQHMADDQVKAIYFSLIRRGTKPVKPNKKDKNHYEQLSFLSDILGGKQNA